VTAASSSGVTSSRRLPLVNQIGPEDLVLIRSPLPARMCVGEAHPRMSIASPNPGVGNISRCFDVAMGQPTACFGTRLAGNGRPCRPLGKRQRILCGKSPRWFQLHIVSHMSCHARKRVGYAATGVVLGDEAAQHVVTVDVVRRGEWDRPHRWASRDRCHGAGAVAGRGCLTGKGLVRGGHRQE